MAVSMTGFIGRNNLAGWACLNPRMALAEHRLMAAYKKAHPVCEACGEDNPERLEVHHIEPLWFNVLQAGTDPEGRFCTLCDHAAINCHLSVGHAMNFAKRFVRNVKAVCAKIREALNGREVVNRENTVDQ